jgi:hypothetical protein
MAVPHTGDLGFTHRRQEEAGHGIPVRPGFNAPYSVPDFLDDQSRILGAIEPGAGNAPCTVDRLEGRMIVLQAPHLSADPEARLVARVALEKKYGRNAGTVLKRFVLVQDFLIEGCSRLDYAGLGRAAEREEVRAEFLSYLLNFRVNPVRPSLPEDALEQFQDEWGHRWM